MDDERREFREVTGVSPDAARTREHPGEGIQADKWRAMIAWLDEITALEEAQRHIAEIGADIESGTRAGARESAEAARLLATRIKATTHSARQSCRAHDPPAYDFIEHWTWTIASDLERNDHTAMRDAALDWLKAEWQSHIDTSEAQQTGGDLGAALESIGRASAYTTAMKQLLDVPTDDTGPVEYAGRVAVIMERAARGDK